MKYTYTNMAPGISLVHNLSRLGRHAKYLIAYTGKSESLAKSYRTFTLEGYKTMDEAVKAATEWREIAIEYGASVADGLLEQKAREAAVIAAQRQVKHEAAVDAARQDVARAMARVGSMPDSWGYINTLGWKAGGFMLGVLMMVGCSYTHPSISEPDLIERIASGHTVCYYKTGPGRGYAKCCPDCPMHADSSAITTK